MTHQPDYRSYMSLWEKVRRGDISPDEALRELKGVPDGEDTQAFRKITRFKAEGHQPGRGKHKKYA